MKFDVDSLSEDFKLFHEAFAPETYGLSMGRAADHAVYDFDKLSDEEKNIAAEWFITLFEQTTYYFRYQYFAVIEKMKDKRFIPLIKEYYKRLKKSRNERNGFETELIICKKVIRSLKNGKPCNVMRLWYDEFWK